MSNRLKTITGLKRKILALVVLWIFLVTQPLLAATADGVSVNFTGCPCTGGSYVALTANVCNNTNVMEDVYGWRFTTASYPGYVGYGGGTLSVSGSAPAVYTQLSATTSQLIATGSCLSSYSYNANPIPAADNGTPYNMQVLLKTGSCNPPVMEPTPTPIANCAAVAAVTATAGYYSTACSPWAENGGPDAGGFINNFSGETQIQVGIPSACFSISGTSVQFNPTAAMGGPMYMMSVAMGQEYFNVDMMQLLAQGAKEQFDGMVNCGGTTPLFISTNTTGVAGLFSEESYTFVSRVQGFPQFFPAYSCVATEPDATTAISSCPNMSCSGGQALYYYLSPTTACSTTSYIGGNSAETANSVVVAALNLWELYDALQQSTNLCWKNSLQGTTDPNMATKFLASGYNQGLNSGFQNSLPTTANLGCASFPQASNYVCDVMTAYQAIENASKCNGSAVSIYDANITWANVQSFFWGDGATPPCTMGTGGLLMHFNLTCAQETSLYTALQCAFTTLSSHWGGGGVATGTISYRYDWLTLLRVAREYLATVNEPLAIPNSSDFNLFVTNNSTNASACGSTVETAFPSLNVVSPATVTNPTVTNVCPPFTLQINATDSASVSLAQWTLDGNWGSWNTFSGTGPGYSTSITSATAGMPSSGPVTIWVSATNPCGNTVVQEVDLNVLCSVNTPTMTSTSTQTSTQTPTATKTNSATATSTNSSTQTPTPSPTSTSTHTVTNTATASNSPTASQTSTSTATIVDTATSTPTATPQNTATSTPTETVTSSYTATAVNSYTSTTSMTSTATLADTATNTQTNTSTETAVNSYTPTQTQTSTVTLADTATSTVTQTYTATLADTATMTNTTTSTSTLASTATMTYTTTSTSTMASTATSTITATSTWTGVPTSTSTTTATSTATGVSTATSTSTYTPILTPTFTPTVNNGFFISKNVFFPRQEDLLIHVSVINTPGNYGVFIYNSAGEHIKTMDQRNLDGSYTNTYSWDGTNKYGAPCASGIYIVYVTEPLQTLRGRVVLIR